MSDEERIVLVDEQNVVIGSCKRSERQKDDIGRVSGLWITNSKNEILFAKRSMLKSHDPGLWGPSVAGSVSEGESYEENILRESLEEIGIELSQHSLTKLEVQRIGRSFVQWFHVRLDRDIDNFVLQEEEVDELRWMSYEVAKKDITTNPGNYLKNMEIYIDLVK